MVGRSGAAGERLGEVTARARSLFSRASGKACEMLQKHIVTRPAIRSGKTDCRNMTCCISICAIVLNISPERCVENPSPPCANVNVPGLERAERDQFRHALHRQIGGHDEDIRSCDHLRDRCEVLDRIVGELLVETDVGYERGIARHQQCVAVRRGRRRTPRRGCRRRRAFPPRRPACPTRPPPPGSAPSRRSRALSHSPSGVTPWRSAMIQVRAGLHQRLQRVGVIACRHCRARSTPSARSSRDC